MGELTGKPYRPSNGTEGMIFTSQFCDNCIHEKFTHTQDFCDKQCKILNESMLEGHVKELVYDENDKPSCTAFIKCDWGNDEDGWNDSNIEFPFYLTEEAYDKFMEIEGVEPILHTFLNTGK